VHALHEQNGRRRGRARRSLARPREDRMRHPHDEDFVAQASCNAANKKIPFR